MILVRRIFAGDEKKLADIEARFLATRPSSNPVMTLVAVASGQPAPVLVRFLKEKLEKMLLSLCIQNF